MFAWDPAQYSRYESHRLRPALDLLARVNHPAPSLVYDLGTGRGEIARIIAERYPAATVIGTDTSAEMLAEAAAAPSSVQWRQADVRDWDPPQAPDVVYSNAVLHWVTDHEEIFPRLAASLASGGVLAIQMPLSWGEPSHQLMRDTLLALDLGSTELRATMERRPVAEPEFYYTILEPHLKTIDIWSTRYLQRLSGPDPVLEWVTGTGLRPVLDELDEEQTDRFLERYSTSLREAYPPMSDGTTLYPFPRLFIVGTR